MLRINITLMMMVAACTTSPRHEENVGTTGENNCRLSAGSLSAIKMLIPKADESKISNASQIEEETHIEIDSTAFPLCIRQNGLTVYFVKAAEVAEGLIVNTLYLGFCSNDSSNQRSTELTYFSDHMITMSDSAWIESMRLLTDPKIALEDLDGDGWPELIVKERLHNGTVYHAVAARIYQIHRTTMNLDYLFSFEEIGFFAADNTYVKRTLKGNEVQVYWAKDLTDKGQLVASYSVDFSNPGKPFNVVVKDDEFKDDVFSSHPNSRIPEPY